MAGLFAHRGGVVADRGVLFAFEGGVGGGAGHGGLGVGECLAGALEGAADGVGVGAELAALLGEVLGPGAVRGGGLAAPVGLVDGRAYVDGDLGDEPGGVLEELRV
ncbi:hypothetical protein JGS22_002790 [Streptomyces sp. P38-E01]|uniref:Uncharacterized protein n=1 Tax=Streptomyces tardus TaxID=2780544 RepID=A0A949JLY8_9ACTN|nr:hypothetical protein [Streptomyces tardus]MBU7596590.1 hypothetical protein [Streptomyces tardus]